MTTETSRAAGPVAARDQAPPPGVPGEGRPGGGTQRPGVIDLFCGAGGAAMGYNRAGFDVVGVDIKPQPRYPFRVLEYDALKVLQGLLTDGHFSWLSLRDFDAIHASPPCQDHSATKVLNRGHGTAWLLLATRELLSRSGLPWVIENVDGAPLARQGDLFGANGLELCGCMFPELRGQLYENRLFEASWWIPPLPHRLHVWPQTKMGRPPKPGECMQVTGHFSDVPEARRRMGIDWMTQDELAQAIPPAYTKLIGARLLEHLREAAA